jgi:hypothetical protein
MLATFWFEQWHKAWSVWPRGREAFVPLRESGIDCANTGVYVRIGDIFELLCDLDDELCALCDEFDPLREHNGDNGLERTLKLYWRLFHDGVGGATDRRTAMSVVHRNVEEGRVFVKDGNAFHKWGQLDERLENITYDYQGRMKRSAIQSGVNHE